MNEKDTNNHGDEHNKRMAEKDSLISDKKHDLESPSLSSEALTDRVKDDAINATSLLDDLEEKVERAKRKYRIRHRIGVILDVLFFNFWLICIPMALTGSEGWTYQSAWYYSIQAGFGVGYGAISVETQGMYYLLTAHIFLGSLYVAYMVSTSISWSIQKSADMHKKGEAEENTGKMSLGQKELGLRPFFVAAFLYILVLVMGILYGTLREGWHFSKSLLFIASTCQTSGLIAPDINPYNEEAIFNPLFVMFLVAVGVPIWAYKIGQLCVIFIRYDSNKKSIITVMERREEAQAAVLRIEKKLNGENSDEDARDKRGSKGLGVVLDPTKGAQAALTHMKKLNIKIGEKNNTRDDNNTNIDTEKYSHVDRFGFLTFCLLEQNLIGENTILNIMKEYDYLKNTGSTDSEPLKKDTNGSDGDKKRRITVMKNDDLDDSVPLWKINAHLQFLQMVELKLASVDAWPQFLKAMEAIERSKRLPVENQDGSNIDEI